jgi:NAD(P)-dependent dehydrogenase (short-subunit alcohol dehydrogenase family)
MYRTLRCDPKLFQKDLKGRTYIVTGANSGTGLTTVETLVRQGAHVVAACRLVKHMAPTWLQKRRASDLSAACSA